jgi:hypothetical protein
VLARNLVLLHIIEGLDPNRRDDMEFLWSVWFNVFWDEDTAKRFTESVRSLLDFEILERQDGCSDHSCPRQGMTLDMKVGSLELASRLKEILRWWAEADQHVSVDEVQRTRCDTVSIPRQLTRD